MKKFCECCGQALAALTWGAGLPAYRLNKSMPGVKAGVVFVMIPSSVLNFKEYIARSEWLTNAWYRGNCQDFGEDQQWCPGVFLLPNTAIDDPTWFTRIKNNGEYSYS